MGRPSRGNRARTNAWTADRQIILEWVLAACVLASLAWVGWQYLYAGYLPHPFNADPFESRMDFYNTAYWANRTGAYTEWPTVYPPLTFLTAQLFTDAACYATPYAGRACDPAGAFWIYGFYLINVALVFFAFRRSNRAVALPRTLALSLGVPMLYSVDLANFIIPCFTFFVFAQGGFPIPSWARFLALGVAINFKPYLLAIAVPRVVALHWRWLIALALACSGIYAVTYLLYGAGAPTQILLNLFIYANSQSDIYAQTNRLPAIARETHDIWQLTMPVLLRFGEAAALLGIVIGRKAEGEVGQQRVAALAISVLCAEAAVNTQGFSADYTQVFLLLLVFREKIQCLYSCIAVSIGYLLCVSIDIPIVRILTESGISYLSGREVLFHYSLSLGQFVRPILIVAMQLCIFTLLAAERERARRYRTPS